jgi:hypothetical protein
MTALSSVKEHSYLIIGGTTKAATTSVFSYLAEHPQVCASSLKESRFFLDADYPLSSKYRFEDSLDKYEELFQHCHDAQLLRLEATPDYLYSPATPQKIKFSLHQVKIAFILREPISRLISWYRFAKQIGQLSTNFSFEAYVQEQFQAIEAELPRPQHMRALEQGRYSLYLRPYFDLFGQDNIHIAFQEDLSRDPAFVLKELCSFAGIDPTFYSDYQFKIINSTKGMKNANLHRAYMQFLFRTHNFVHNKAAIRAILRRIRLVFEYFYFRLNTQPPEQVTISSSARKVLDAYYSQEAKALADLIGKAVPWQLAQAPSSRT